MTCPPGRGGNWPPAPTRAPTRTCSSAWTSATSCTTAGSTGVDDRWEWEPALLAAAPGRSRSGSRRRCARRCPYACRRAEPVPHALAALADGRRRAVAVDVPAAAGRPRAVPRVRHPPLGLPAQGGRPAHLGDPAAGRPAPRRRWWRSRPTSTAAAGPSACTRELFARTHARARTWTTPTAPTWTRSPAITLAIGNLMSLFGLHRRLRGAIVGHLAAFEMTSSLPQPPLRQRPAPARRRRGRDPVLRRARRGRRRARADRRARPVRRVLRAASPQQAAQVLFGAACASPSTASSPGTSWAAGKPVSPRCAPSVSEVGPPDMGRTPVGARAPETRPACGCRRRTV